MKFGYTLFLAALLLIVLSGQAHAYIDPGTGSFVLQMVIAGLVGAAFAIRLYWTKIKAFLLAKFARRRTPAEDEGDEDAE